MLRNGGHLLGDLAVDVLKAVPGREGTPNFVGPEASAQRNAGFKNTFSRQLAGHTMGRMSVEFFIQCIDLGRSEAGQYLDEPSPHRCRIDRLRRVRFVAKDHLVDAQDVGGTKRLFSSYVDHPLLRQREGIGRPATVCDDDRGYHRRTLHQFGHRSPHADFHIVRMRADDEDVVVAHG